uniref:Uncharacterized protein n=1 Tax=Rhizophora mucronata TaxID=61149 RepID=A0A2P2JCD1_RHIMU
MDRQRMETKKNNYYNNSNNVVGVVSNNKKPLEWLNEPYYLLHFLAFFAYFILRSSAAQFLSPHSVRHLLHRVTLSSLSLYLNQFLILFSFRVYCIFVVLSFIYLFIYFLGDSSSSGIRTFNCLQAGESGNMGGLCF